MSEDWLLASRIRCRLGDEVMFGSSGEFENKYWDGEIQDFVGGLRSV